MIKIPNNFKIKFMEADYYLNERIWIEYDEPFYYLGADDRMPEGERHFLGLGPRYRVFVFFDIEEAVRIKLLCKRQSKVFNDFEEQILNGTSGLDSIKSKGWD
jgi:hypothetical protein